MPSQTATPKSVIVSNYLTYPLMLMDEIRGQLIGFGVPVNINQRTGLRLVVAKNPPPGGSWDDNTTLTQNAWAPAKYTTQGSFRARVLIDEWDNKFLAMAQSAADKNDTSVLDPSIEQRVDTDALVVVAYYATFGDANYKRVTKVGPVLRWSRYPESIDYSTFVTQTQWKNDIPDYPVTSKQVNSEIGLGNPDGNTCVAQSPTVDKYDFAGSEPCWYSAIAKVAYSTNECAGSVAACRSTPDNKCTGVLIRKSGAGHSCTRFSKSISHNQSLTPVTGSKTVFVFPVAGGGTKPDYKDTDDIATTLAPSPTINHEFPTILKTFKQLSPDRLVLSMYNGQTAPPIAMPSRAACEKSCKDAPDCVGYNYDSNNTQFSFCSLISITGQGLTLAKLSEDRLYQAIGAPPETWLSTSITANDALAPCFPSPGSVATLVGSTMACQKGILPATDPWMPKIFTAVYLAG
jgi:hypothetical protein